jgi:hypothetical protein
LLTHENLAVYYASASQIPNVLREIGRLREISFRQAGEGTGSSIDIDEFDSRYYHLFIWNRAQNEIAGAYRLAGTDDIVSRHGKNGLYTNTLFRFSPDFFNRIHPALELGRSFVRPEYQKSYLPLLLLWKGIGHFVAQRPWYRVLFGPVSISASYTSMSQSLIVLISHSLFPSSPGIVFEAILRAGVRSGTWLRCYRILMSCRKRSWTWSPTARAYPYWSASIRLWVARCLRLTWTMPSRARWTGL